VDHGAPVPIRHTQPASTRHPAQQQPHRNFLCRGQLLTNHVHLLITPHEEQSIAKAIQMLGRYYVQYYNYSY
jgi:REP element-mobilizing transposase RayT